MARSCHPNLIGVALLGAVLLRFSSAAATNDGCPGPPSVNRCNLFRLSCPPKDMGSPTYGNCPVDPHTGNDRLLCCSQDKCGNRFQVWCVSAAPRPTGNAAQFVGVYTPTGGMPSAIGGCWFEDGFNKFEMKCNQKGKFSLITWTNTDTARKNATYHHWVYEYRPDHSGPGRPGELKRTGIKDNGSRDPDCVRTTPPPNFTDGLLCARDSQLVFVGTVPCSVFVDTLGGPMVADSTAEAPGDRCEIAEPLPFPYYTQVNLGAFADNYFLEDCATNAVNGPDAFYAIHLEGPGHTGVHLTATPFGATDVALILFTACDSCIAGSNANGAGGAEQLDLALPPGDYTICVKGVAGPPDYVQLVADRTTAVPPVGPPGRFRLALTGANPARAFTMFRFTLPEEQLVRLELFDPAGRLVRALVSDRLPAATFERVWDLRDRNGARVPAGIYFARLQSSSGETSLPVSVLD